MIQAIKGISFEVNEGETVALIGAQRSRKNNNPPYHYRTALAEKGQHQF